MSDTGRQSGEISGPQDCGLASRTRLYGAAGKNSALFGPRAATLDQNEYQDNRQHGANNLDNRSIAHIDSSFPQ